MCNIASRIKSNIYSNISSAPGFKKEEFTLTKSEFNAGLTACGYEAISEGMFINIRDELLKLNNKNEAAMLVAHMIHETGGFKYHEEILAKTDPEKAQKQYSTKNGVKGKSYHGRGYLMLSWPENYKNVSYGLELNDDLLKHPEKVADDPKLRIKSAVYYWNSVVKKSKNVCDSNFNASTLEINGAIEGSGYGLEMARHRFNIYKTIAKAFKVDKIACK
ncbi:hypothetical protein COBT_003372 [Conglomerata obtusa]